ncbi:MAG: helix-turn-helix transcriptional regulator [Nitrospirae bacterium]|nr:helix-turn-helix transcriptional regulator [Nitrospirota bacterium]
MNGSFETISPLSKREVEVLNWLKNGKSSWDIATILNISERTVNFHVRNIMQKLNAVSRTQAVAVAIENNLINTILTIS